MNNFNFYNPVNIVFGKGSIAELPGLLPRDTKIMMTYGGGSIKKNGVYDQTLKALEGFNFIEFGGIEPNPHYETCMKAVEIIKQEKVGFLLAVGGGSVLDGTKFIAAAAKWDKGDPWDIPAKKLPLKSAVPLGSIITLPATGSEMNCNSVVSRASTHEKFDFHDPAVYPAFSIIDPECTYSLPESQTVNGIIDSFVHVAEQYITYDVNSPIQDRFSESILRTLIEEGPKVLENPFDYDSRANIFWSTSMALNGLISAGAAEDWCTHMIGHELTAAYGLDHARTLACVMPAVWRYKFADKKQKLAQYARRVWGLNCDCDDFAAKQAIILTEEFFHAVKMPTKLAAFGIDPKEAAAEVMRRFESQGRLFGEHQDIDATAAFKIVENA
ncbi:iron-containing alcohol dehydrogenase [Lentisphaerota bacterium ZTH]|nr:iron-containing alcohol dehydrogenase [Lentisphaerota bacterium]WET07071.1 iron-containing alcohol dehydrogenase [Lentisphaerota bacterium ZTH]